MSKDSRRWVLVAGLVGAIGVGLGAFGAHGLPGWLAALGYEGDDLARRTEIFATATRYQLIHALALGLGAVLLDRSNRRAWRWACWAFLAGVVIFSGLLYVLTFVGSDFRWLGAIVPLGGLSMIAGWLLLAFGACGDD